MQNYSIIKAIINDNFEEVRNLFHLKKLSKTIKTELPTELYAKIMRYLKVQEVDWFLVGERSRMRITTGGWEIYLLEKHRKSKYERREAARQRIHKREMDAEAISGAVRKF